MNELTPPTTPETQDVVFSHPDSSQEAPRTSTEVVSGKIRPETIAAARVIALTMEEATEENAHTYMEYLLPDLSIIVHYHPRNKIPRSQKPYDPAGIVFIPPQTR